ncbi:MAG: host attachment family protein, partial [Pseudomonadota bacterium]
MPAVLVILSGIYCIHPTQKATGDARIGCGLVQSDGQAQGAPQPASGFLNSARLPDGTIAAAGQFASDCTQSTPRGRFMSSKTHFIRIPHNAYVLVGDGRKALFLRNEGSEISPRLKTEQVFLNDNPPTRKQGSDQPGRSFQSVGSHRSAVEQTDWHEIEERRFARTIADTLEGLARDRTIPGFIIA